MAYQVVKKQHERRDDRSLDIDGIVYKPRKLTIGLDRELRPIRAELDEAYAELAKQSQIASAQDEEWNPLPASERPTAEARREAGRKAAEAGDAVAEISCRLIAAALGPSDTGELLTAENLQESLELDDIRTYRRLLFGEISTLDEGPTGDSDAA